MRFSIIIPAYNVEATIERCLRSAISQRYSEVIVVDDQSSDATGTRAQLCLSMRKNVAYCRLAKNSGAGPARNYGMRIARGDWLIFLDADDTLTDDAMFVLSNFIDLAPADVDIIGYNPRDAKWLRGEKGDLLNAYAAMRMDGSVIYTAFRRSLIQDLRFRAGLHEDAAFMYAAYRKARRTAFFETEIYRKGPDGVTASISTAHIDGFVNAWRDVTAMASRDNAPWKHVEQGIIGFVATRVREIYRKALNSLDKTNLLHYFYDALPHPWIDICKKSTLTTQYALAAKAFVNFKNVQPEMFKRTWSCKDLQYSAYLGPEEVRACCKRFFVDGERRGDVVLLGEGDMINAHTIHAAKLQLLDEINTGEETCCDGCPWLEFKQHDPVLLKVDYLSMEHHSVCNLKCSYCPSMYYDGRRPTYDVAATVNSMLADGATVVWGGGEPTVSPEFKQLAPLFSKLNARQRVLTNSVKLSRTLQALMVIDENVEMVISVDAGTIDTFKKVRGANKLATVLHNLTLYAEHSPDRVTIKYILTEQNDTDMEIIAFVQLMVENNLLRCNFQISCDFQQEEATMRQVESIKLLSDLLIAAGTECVFIDDLCRLRLPLVMTNIHAIIVGTGEQADRIKNRIHCVALLESDSPDAQFAGTAPILIAASQSYPRIFHELKARGLSYRVLKGLVL